LRGLNWDNIAARMAAEVKIDLPSDYVIAQYRAHHPDWTPEQVYYAATTAGRSWPGQVIEADARASAGAEKTWVYCLTRRSPVDPLRGAAHTDDIPYVFGTLDAPGSFSGTDSAAKATSAALQGAFGHLAYDRLADRAMTQQRLRVHADVPLLGRVGIGHIAAVEPVRAACDIG
jgi:para-nitrobenzyl esterase